MFPIDPITWLISFKRLHQNIKHKILKAKFFSVVLKKLSSASSLSMPIRSVRTVSHQMISPILCSNPASFDSPSGQRLCCAYVVRLLCDMYISSMIFIYPYLKIIIRKFGTPIILLILDREVELHTLYFSFNMCYFFWCQRVLLI